MTFPEHVRLMNNICL